MTDLEKRAIEARKHLERLVDKVLGVKRRCNRCKNQIGRHDKYTRYKVEGVIKYAHRNCNNPTSYK